ncbi:hypothetical protein AMS68_002396 [Peltaster fructicola]|uniref:DNA-directed RNA polymerase subunit n=1 Tax=Peltaster fructicola TaxID=286661 RepID=A0A6H0XQI6_9PEZI|nr:hypothetical protein AMS68_002396 [Peltaster fructicola]
MYVLVTLADVVEIKPHDFGKPSERAIEDWINDKYADKVLNEIGLCVGFHSLIKSSEGLIGHGDGLVSVNVDFRLIVFRPFKGEIIMGTITNCDPQDGIFMSTEFFDDIQVPPSVLPENTVFEPEQGVFIWKYKDEEDPEQVTEYYFDKAEKCLMRIEMEQWVENQVQQTQEEQLDLAEEQTRASNLQRAPYSIQASMMHAGTGPKIWWLDAEVNEDGDVQPEADAGEVVAA